MPAPPREDRNVKAFTSLYSTRLFIQAQATCSSDRRPIYCITHQPIALRAPFPESAVQGDSTIHRPWALEMTDAGGGSLGEDYFVLERASVFAGLVGMTEALLTISDHYDHVLVCLTLMFIKTSSPPLQLCHNEFK